MKIEKPKIVSDAYDEIVKKYFYTYPITYYIRDSINKFREEINQLTKMVDVEDEQSQSERDERKSKINFLSQYCDLLEEEEEELDAVRRRNNVEEPEEFRKISDFLFQEIDGWKKGLIFKKVKIEGDEEAKKVAEKFRKDLKYYGEKFCKNFTDQLAISKNEILEKNRKRNEIFCRKVSNLLNEFEPDVQKSYNGLIRNAKYDFSFLTNESDSSTDELNTHVKEIYDGLLQLKDNQEGESGYYYDKWREYVKDEMGPFVEFHREKSHQDLNEFSDSVASEYIGHIKKLIKEQTQKKDEMASKLAEEERLFQKDRDWLNEFKRQLELIERE